MDTVLQATVFRIKSFEDDTIKLTDDLDYVINNISNQNTKAALITDNFIQTCFTLCKNDKLSPSHIIQCLPIIQKLVVLYSARQIVIIPDINIEQSFISDIAKLLNSKDENVRYNACKLLSIICFFEDSINIISNSEITQILYDLLLTDKTYNVISETLKSLSFITNYIRNTPENVVQKMIEILHKTDKTDIYRCESNLKCLRNICTKWDIKEIAIKYEIVKSISKFLSTTYARQEPNICKCACGVLMTISVCENGKDSMINKNPNIITSLGYLVSSKNIDINIQNNAAIILQNISDHPMGLIKIGKELIHKHSLLIKLFGMDKSAKIGHFYMKIHEIKEGETEREIKKKQRQNELIQQSAVQLLALVAQQKDGIHSVWACLNILPQLIDIFMMAEKDRIIAVALDCIIMLCQNNETAQRILRKEARRSKCFFETAKKFELLQPYLTPELM